MKTVIAELLLLALVLPAAAQSLGSRDNPVPIGTSADMLMLRIGYTSNIWQITVLNVFPNATDDMVYGSASLDRKLRLDPGEEFFLAKIQAKYIGPGSSYFECNDLSAVGSASVGYRALSDMFGINDCIPSYREVFTGGVITGVVAWMIPQAHADHLVMYTSATDFNNRTYMALY